VAKVSARVAIGWAAAGGDKIMKNKIMKTKTGNSPLAGGSFSHRLVFHYFVLHDFVSCTRRHITCDLKLLQL
jgi:hypothetical protein